MHYYFILILGFGFLTLDAYSAATTGSRLDTRVRPMSIREGSAGQSRSGYTGTRYFLYRRTVVGGGPRWGK